MEQKPYKVKKKKNNKNRLNAFRFVSLRSFLMLYMVKCSLKPSRCLFLRRRFLKADVKIHMTTPTQDPTPCRHLPNFTTA